MNELNLLGDLLTLTFRLIPLVEVVQRSGDDSLQETQGILALLRSLDNLPQEHSVVQSESELDCIDFLGEEIVVVTLRNISCLLVVLPGFFLIHKLKQLLVLITFIEVPIFEIDGWIFFILFFDLLTDVHPGKDFCLIDNGSSILVIDIPANRIIEFLSVLCHVSVDICLKLQEEDQSKWFSRNLDAVVFQDFNLLFTLAAQVVDETVFVHLHALLFLLELRFLFQKLNVLDGMSVFLELTFEGAGNEFEVFFCEDLFHGALSVHFMQGVFGVLAELVIALGLGLVIRLFVGDTSLVDMVGQVKLAPWIGGLVLFGIVGLTLLCGLLLKALFS